MKFFPRFCIHWSSPSHPRTTKAPEMRRLTPSIPGRFPASSGPFFFRGPECPLFSGFSSLLRPGLEFPGARLPRKLAGDSPFALSQRSIVSSSFSSVAVTGVPSGEMGHHVLCWRVLRSCAFDFMGPFPTPDVLGPGLFAPFYSPFTGPCPKKLPNEKYHPAFFPADAVRKRFSGEQIFHFFSGT